jgi:hypothetical protein
MIVIHPRNARRLESEGMFAIGIAYRVGRGVKSDKPGRTTPGIGAQNAMGSGQTWRKLEIRSKSEANPNLECPKSNTTGAERLKQWFAVERPTQITGVLRLAPLGFRVCFEFRDSNSGFGHSLGINCRLILELRFANVQTCGWLRR